MPDKAGDDRDRAILKELKSIHFTLKVIGFLVFLILAFSTFRPR